MKTKTKIPTQQSDIVISADGTIHISFLWDDLRSLVEDNGSEVTSLPQKWSPPSEVLPFNSKEYSSCMLCPKTCGFNRNRYAHPTCGDAKLRISNVGLSFGDEKEIKGSGGSGAIMLSGCPLTCPSCHNPEKVAYGKESDISEFLQLCEDLMNKGAENIQILSPTVHLPALRTALSILKESSFPLPIVFKSSGYENLDELNKLKGLVDVYLPDFKFGTCSSWGKRAGVNDYYEKAKEALFEMISQVGAPVYNSAGTIQRGVIVRHVLAPLPEGERNEILAFLHSVEGISLSLQDTFVDLE